MISQTVEREMYKIAFFVEGKTERLLIEKMIEEFAKPHAVFINSMEAEGGGRDKKTPVSYKAIEIKKELTNEQFYVLIVDCGGENNVKPRIDEEHKNLHDKGYELIIGIRDVRPKFGVATLSALKTIMNTAIDKTLTPVMFVLPLAEVEAWFLAEHTHFPKIEPTITSATISQQLGFDPASDDMTLRANPADDLNACYQIGNRAYNKKKAKRTIAALDMSQMRLALPDRISELKRLVRTIERFFSPPPTLEPPQAGSVQAVSEA